MAKVNPTIYLDIFNSTSRARKLLSAPFIYSMIIPIVILDFFLEIYHQTSFRIYRMPIIQRSDYIFLNRGKLSKLTILQKLNCLYCGYVNGLLAYGVKIAGESEKYWCSIRHIDEKSIETQPHHKEFIDSKEFE
jgi:hypothetical protein